MELRHTLLQSDIDHMAKNFRVLSAELITLQDFIQKQFGKMDG
jgi:Sec7-like guanine-nucleotide exchange factor